MLSENEFWTQIERLGSAFGERNFLPGRMKDVYSFLKPLSAGEFSSAVSHLIDESTHPPTPAKIKEACRPLVDRANQIARSIAAEKYQKAGSGHWCQYCGNTGVITAVLKEGVYDT